MPNPDEDKGKKDVTPVELLIEENKKFRAEIDELKKQVAEYREFAVATTRRVISNEHKKEESGNKLDDIVANYKKGYER